MKHTLKTLRDICEDEQAKTLKEWNDQIFWERIPIGDTDDYELRPIQEHISKLNEKLVSVESVKQELSLLVEKERSLRKLLENRPEPKFVIIGTQEKEYDRVEIVDWFLNFIREFVGLKKIIGDDGK